MNWKRGSTRGLSLMWALANFTASLVNVFFVLRLDLPLYSLIMAVYMPALEACILAQMAWVRVYGEPQLPPSQTRRQVGPSPLPRLVCFLCCMGVWVCVIAVEAIRPDWTESMQWIATVLWCVETFPQLELNAALGTGDGQAPLTVAVTVAGKTADMLGSFVVRQPLQVRVLCFFSTATAFLDALQVLWYRNKGSAVAGAAADTTGPVLQSGQTDDEHDEHPLLTVGHVSPRAASSDARKGALALIGASVVAALLAFLCVLTVLFVPAKVAVGLFAAEISAALLCIMRPWQYYVPDLRARAHGKTTMLAADRPILQ